MKTDFRETLKSRGLNGWDAYLCSVRGRNIATAFLDEVADVFKQFFEYFRRGGRRQVRESLVFPKTASALLSPKRYVGEARSFGRNYMKLQTLSEDGSEWEDDAEFELPHHQDQAVAVDGALRVTARALRDSAPHDGHECVRKKLWKQSKLRRQVTILSSTKLKSRQSTRSIGDRKLNLRTPHR